MQRDQPLVYVIDDDVSVRHGLDSLLRSAGYEVRCFASALEFPIGAPRDQPACVVLDLRMPDLSGIDFQEHLGQGGQPIPVVFLTGHGDVSLCARAMKAGAVDFLLKPFRESDLLEAIEAAIDNDRGARLENAVVADLRRRFETLTRRERQVMALVVTGRPNKQVATELGLSEIAVKVNRGQAMRKMAADTFADLIRMADRIGLVTGLPNSPTSI